MSGDILNQVLSGRLVKRVTGWDDKKMNRHLYGQTNNGPITVQHLLESFSKVALVVDRANASGRTGTDDELTLVIQKDKELLLNLQIKNQKELGTLIEKAAARLRMIKTLTLFGRLARSFIQATAREMPGDYRDNERRLYQMWNTLFEEIRSASIETKSWAEDGATRLLASRLESLRDQEDNEFEAEVNGELDEMIESESENRWGESDE